MHDAPEGDPAAPRCVGLYPTLAVPDVREACDWYITCFGFELRFLYGDPVTHGAVLFGAACLHFWEGVPQPNANWIYFDVTDLEAIHTRAQARGVTIMKAPADYPWGMREFNAVDLNGYNIRFGQHVDPQP
ncbi:MAG: VOC family protein [Pseudomonadota bacterium]